MNLKRFRVAIFDFDGVIVDSESLQARAWTRVAHELGMRERSVAVSEIAGRIDVELAAELFPGHDALRCARDKARAETELEATEGLRLVRGVDRFVNRLARTHQLAVCSSCQHDLLARRLARTGLGQAFQVVVGRTGGVPHKPAPDLYRRALAGLGVVAHDAFAIEDSSTGVAAAKAAGIYVIQLVHAALPRARDADEWVGSYDELRHRVGRRQRP